MGYVCIISGCKTGYKSEKRKQNQSYALFRTPQHDVARLQQWEQNIPTKIKLKSSHRVCEKHFTNECIVRKTIINYNNPLIPNQEILLPQPHLTVTAIPTIFSNYPSCLSTTEATPEESIVRKPFIKIKKRINEIIEENDSVLQINVANSPDQAPDNVEIVYSVNDRDCLPDIEIERSMNQMSPKNSLTNELFQHGFENLPQSWGYHKVQKNNMFFIILSKMILISNNTLPIIEKQIWFDVSLQYRCTILSKPVDLNNFTTVNPIMSISDIYALIKIIDNMSVCLGTLKNDSVSNVSGFIDITGNWRSERCAFLLITGRKTCSYCKLLSRTITSKIWRNKQISSNQPIARVRLSVSNSNKVKHTAIKKKLHVERNRNTRAQRTIDILKNNIAKLKTDISNMNESVIDEKLKSLNVSASQKTIILEILAASKVSHPKGNRYTEEWILICLLINMRSPSSYNFLRNNEILPLPCVRTIRKYLTMTSQKCGFDERFLLLLKKKISKKEDFQKDGILLLDEISLREAVRIKTSTMTYTGLIDYGEDGPQATNLNQKANSALVFMFRPFADSYVQPIGVFVGKGPTKGDLLAKLVVKAIILLEQTGLRIHGVVSDGALTNRKMWTELGVSGALNNVKNSFNHPLHDERRIYALSDVPHLIKCIRNRLESKNLKTHQSGDDICCNHFRLLYKSDIDIDKPGKLRVCSKIFAGHINLTSMSKMRVKLATQIFSKSVATGLEFYKNRNVKGLENCDATIEFCIRINNMFDAMNRRAPKEGIRKDSQDLQYLRDSLNWLDNWELEKLKGNITSEQFLTNTTAEGLRVTITSMIDLCEFLLTERNYKYVLTGKINQDPVERFFGTIRQAGGADDHPCTPTFLQLYNILSLYAILKPPKYGNCVIDTDQPIPITLAEIREAYQDSNSQNFRKQLKERFNNLIDEGVWECEDVIQLDHSYHLEEAADCVNYYVTGYLCFQLKKHTKCQTCIEAFCNLSYDEHNSYSVLVNMKSRGRLMHPNIHFFAFIRKIEETLTTHIQKPSVYEDTIEDLMENIQFTFPCQLHKSEILSYIIHYYITMRLRQYTRHLNLEIEKKSSHKKKQAKLSIT